MQIKSRLKAGSRAIQMRQSSGCGWPAMLHALDYDATWINKLAPAFPTPAPSQSTFVQSHDILYTLSRDILYTPRACEHALGCNRDGVEDNGCSRTTRAFCSGGNAADANVSRSCAAYEISRPTGYLWLRRYRELGVDGIAERSRKPHRSPERTNPELERQVVQLRQRYPDWARAS